MPMQIGTARVAGAGEYAYDFLKSSYVDTDANPVHLPINHTSEQAAANYLTAIQYPCDGYIEAVYLWTVDDPGETDVEVHKADSGSGSYSKQGATVTKTPGATTRTKYAFDSAPGGDYSFSAGERVSIMHDPTNNPSQVSAMIVVRLNLQTVQ